MSKILQSGNLAAAGSTTALDISDFMRSEFAVHTSGNDGGGALTIELASDDPPTNWVPLYDIDGAKFNITDLGTHFFLAIGRWLRLTLTGGAAHNLDWEIWH